MGHFGHFLAFFWPHFLTFYLLFLQLLGVLICKFIHILHFGGSDLQISAGTDKLRDFCTKSHLHFLAFLSISCIFWTFLHFLPHFLDFLLAFFCIFWGCDLQILIDFAFFGGLICKFPRGQNRVDTFFFKLICAIQHFSY